MWGHLTIQRGVQTGGTQTYGGHPNIQGVSKHGGTSDHTEGSKWGKPNIWTTSKHTGGVQTCGASDHTEGSKQGGTQTYRGIPTHGVSKHIGASKHTGDHPNIWWHPNIWQQLNIQGASKCMGAYGHPLVWQSMLYLCCLCTGGIQTSSKHMGAGP